MTIEERLEVVERELAVSRRRTRRLWISLGLAGAVCALVWSLTATTSTAKAQEPGKVIRANAFIVEDENGKGRAMLNANKDGTGLSLRDENGQIRAGIDAYKDGPMLGLYDENEKVRAELGVGQTETPDGRIITHPESSLRLYKPVEKVIWSAP
ncbi:MAG TPA: hypothetical protein VM123_19910 [archaeon]|nr:hypothetical protein [archaeon]